MSLIKPKHNKYLLHKLNKGKYFSLANKYWCVKKYGWRTTVGIVTENGVVEISKELINGSIKRCGKQKIGTAIILFWGYALTPISIFVTNSTKILKVCNVTHSILSSGAEILEDSVNLVWLPLDIICFGQLIPMGENNRFNLMGNMTNITSEFEN